MNIWSDSEETTFYSFCRNPEDKSYDSFGQAFVS